MSFMRRLLLSMALLFNLLAGGLLFAQTAGAIDLLDPVCSQADPNNLPPACKDSRANRNSDPLLGPDGVITKVVRILSLVIGATSVVVIVIAGIKFMTSFGDSAKISSARQTIIYACIGLAVTGVAQIVVAFILSKL